jgi:hypothetical protein
VSVGCGAGNPGATHWSGCACHEAEWKRKLCEAEARLNRIREWAGGLGWLGSPQDERVETEALAILDSVDRWQSCPDYIRGLPHTECAKCGGFGAVPAPQKGAPE